MSHTSELEAELRRIDNDTQIVFRRDDRWRHLIVSRICETCDGGQLSITRNVPIEEMETCNISLLAAALSEMRVELESERRNNELRRM